MNLELWHKAIRRISRQRKCSYRDASFIIKNMTEEKRNILLYKVIKSK